jgi:hypothetical protein
MAVRIAQVGALAVLGLLLVPTPHTLATPPGGFHHALGGATEWAYGGNRSFDLSTPARNGTLSLASHFGYQVLLNASSGAPGITQMEVQRTMGAVSRITYCVPSCTTPSLSATIEYHAVEQLTGFVNVTNTSSVRVNGSAVPALGVMNTSSTFQDSIYENDSVNYRGRTASANLSLKMTGGIAAGFSPALGLIPLHRSLGLQWTSNATFVGQGSWGSTSSFHRSSLLGVAASGGNTLNFAANRSGLVGVNGRELGGLVLRGGTVVQILDLALIGPFAVREGFLLLPARADVFHGTAPPNSPEGNASVVEAPTSLDYAPFVGGPIGLVASAATYTSQSNNPGDPAGSGIAPATSLDSSGPQEVQAQPESVAEYSPSSKCLTVEGCAASSAAPASPSVLLRPLVGTVIAVVGVSAILGMALVAARRPRLPPRPNPEVYPPVSSVVPPARPNSKAPPVPSPGATTEPDPLGHLW